MNRVIYCISGLGADERIFSNLQLSGYELKHISWLRPHKKERIDEYAARMAKSIQHPSPILVGVSFGGMMAIEMAKQIPVQQLILISSIKAIDELPRWMRTAGALYLNQLIPMRYYKFTEKIGNDRLGVSTKEEREMVNAYRKQADPVYLNWAIHQILNWKNNWQPEHTLHIHGDKDKIFPIKNIRDPRVIKEGTHFMVYNRAEEISKIIVEELNKLR